LGRRKGLKTLGGGYVTRKGLRGRGGVVLIGQSFFFWVKRGGKGADVSWERFLYLIGGESVE